MLNFWRLQHRSLQSTKGIRLIWILAVLPLFPSVLRIFCFSHAFLFSSSASVAARKRRENLIHKHICRLGQTDVVVVSPALVLFIFFFGYNCLRGSYCCSLLSCRFFFALIFVCKYIGVCLRLSFFVVLSLYLFIVLSSPSLCVFVGLGRRLADVPVNSLMLLMQVY